MDYDELFGLHGYRILEDDCMEMYMLQKSHKYPYIMKEARQMLLRKFLYKSTLEREELKRKLEKAKERERQERSDAQQAKLLLNIMIDAKLQNLVLDEKKEPEPIVQEQKEEPIEEKKQEEKEEDSDSEHDGEEECIICMDGPPKMVFVPCGHLITCTKCSKQVKTCPTCRQDVQMAIKVYRQ